MSLLRIRANRVRELEDIIRRVERLEMLPTGPAEHLPTLGALSSLRQALAGAKDAEREVIGRRNPAEEVKSV